MKHFQAIAYLVVILICHAPSFTAAAKGKRTMKPMDQDSDPTGSPPRQRTRAAAQESEQLQDPSRPRVSRKSEQQATASTHPPSRPARRIHHKTSSSGYVGLQNPAPYVPDANETGYYMWPDYYWFNPTRHDARLLAGRTFDSMQAVFNAYGQRQIARARMQEELQRHREAWESGTRS